ncbi:hypothetical protein Tcan_09116 [Toxocara canis]|uniref:Uncharacterized protein n=1 Tax=Toxocara canis TaxID=6265 RepID=A0A0B2UZJ7_TOXCA|nr:hypothetical protein Tcan_09116 [Toxocara canis]
MTPPLDSVERHQPTTMPTRTAYSRPIAYFTIAVLILATIAISILAAVLLSKRTHGETGEKVTAARSAYGKEFLRIVAQARRVLLRNSLVSKSATEQNTLKEPVPNKN